MRSIPLLLSLFLLSGPSLQAQHLQAYIEEGLRSNTTLQEKSNAIGKALLALKEARSLFLPTASLEAQYTLAKGGRAIDLPIGDLLNPVYKALNGMTGANHPAALENVSEQFLPNNFYDVRIKTAMPLLNPDLRMNRLIKGQEAALLQVDLATYRRELVKEIKVAYYQYCMATEGILIYQAALKLAAQHLKTSQSLLANGKGLPAYVSRASFEVQSVEAQVATAVHEQLNAKAYFNFLLNRPLTDTILIEPAMVEAGGSEAAGPFGGSVKQREELQTAAIATDIRRNLLRLNQAYHLPRVNLFVDMGAQDFKFRMDRQSLLYLAGVQVQVPLFAARRNQYKIRQAILDVENSNLQKSGLQSRLHMAAFVSWNNLQSGGNHYRLAVKKLEAAKSYFHLMNRGYKEGVNSFTELLDAHTRLVETELQINISKYRYLTAQAEYERQTASYPINK